MTEPQRIDVRIRTDHIAAIVWPEAVLTGDGAVRSVEVPSSYSLPWSTSVACIPAGESTELQIRSLRQAGRRTAFVIIPLVIIILLAGLTAGLLDIFDVTAGGLGLFYASLLAGIVLAPLVATADISAVRSRAPRVKDGWLLIPDANASTVAEVVNLNPTAAIDRGKGGRPSPPGP